MPTRFRWQLPQPAPWPALEAIGVQDMVTAQVLHSRGCRDLDDANRFLGFAAAADRSPFAMPGAHEAVAILRWAIVRDKRVVVHGDYDVDGLAATAVVLEGLRSEGGSAKAYIPNRLDTGYGLDARNMRSLAKAADVLVTVDCGIRSVEEVALARRLGMQVIVTDHHLPGPELPPADAVVSSRVPGAASCSELAGVGVAAQVIAALQEVGRRFRAGANGTAPYADLVALGTVADVAPLTGINRDLVRRGLRAMRADPRPGVAALARRAGVDPSLLTAWHIAFVLAPRLNSAGRLGSSRPALDLLMAQDAAAAAPLADQLERCNVERRASLERCLALAQQELQQRPPRAPLVYSAHSSYPQGVVGLVAARLHEEYGLPAVVVAIGEDAAHGSVRSTDAFNANDALDACRDLLSKHGGHSLAAGFACPAAVLEELRQRLEALAEAAIGPDGARPTLAIDAEVPLPGGHWPIWDWLPLLEPTGAGNPRPTFLTRRVTVSDKGLVGRDRSHLLLSLAGDNEAIRAMGFRFGPDFGELPNRIDIVYHLDENTYNGTVERRLMLLDWAPSADA